MVSVIIALLYSVPFTGKFALCSSVMALSQVGLDTQTCCVCSLWRNGSCRLWRLCTGESSRGALHLNDPPFCAHIHGDSCKPVISTELACFSLHLVRCGTFTVQSGNLAASFQGTGYNPPRRRTIYRIDNAALKAERAARRPQIPDTAKVDESIPPAGQ